MATNVETLSEEQQQELMAKYDRESAFRRLRGPMARVVAVLAIIWSLLQLYTAAMGVFPPTLQRAPHLGFALVLVFLLYPLKRQDRSNKIRWYDYLLALLSALVASYHVIFYEPLTMRAGAYTHLDLVVSVLGVLLVLEAVRRVVGWVLLSLAIIFLLYGHFGYLVPGLMGHRGFTFTRILTHSFLSTEGIFGVPIAVSSTFIFLFMIFATFLRKTGIGDWLTGLAVSVTGHYSGGPAKAAVIASALQGTVSGSSVANVVGTGSVTIPLMKSIGYRKEFAGAVEAAASTGGQLMPPIMGAAAFIMTEFTGLPYIKIAAAATIPAILYFTGVFIMVHLEAKRTGLKGIPKSDLPRASQLLKEKWYLLLPIVGIVYFLTTGQTAMKAAFYGILLTILVSFVSKDTRMSFREFLEALDEGARSAVPVAVACATAGILVGVVTLTGVGLKVATGIVSLSHGSIYLTMFFTMIASLILGMGVPTTANYIIQATIAAPALMAVGVPVIAAHLFVFYFGILADVTPPVALAAFAASGISGAEPMKTGFNATKLAFAAYLVPYIFATAPALVLVNVTGLEIVKALITALIGMVGLAGGLSGYLVGPVKWWERIVLIVGGVMLVDPGTLTDIIGIVLVGLMLMLGRFRNARMKDQADYISQ
ncbi:TRAP transporter permease [Paradesulfitobacterium aromaticivorans]